MMAPGVGRTLTVSMDLPLDFVHACTAVYAQAQVARLAAAASSNDFWVYVMARGLKQVEEELA